MATGWWDGGTFVPFGATIESVEDKRIYVGKIAKWGTNPDNTRVTCSLQPLDRVLGEAVAYRLPTLEVGLPEGQVPVDGQSDRVQFALHLFYVEPPDSFLGAVTIDVQLAPNLVDGQTSGVFSLNVLQGMITRALQAELDAIGPPWWLASSKIYVNLESPDGTTVCTVYLRTVGASGITLSASIQARQGTVWRQLGFTGTHQVSVEQTSVDTDLEFTAQRKLPGVYISGTGDPLNPSGLRIWYTSLRGPALDFDPGYDDAAGAAVGAYVRVDEEVFAVSASTSYTTFGLQFYYLTVTRRGQLGSLLQEHYIEAGEDIDDGVQLVAFPGVELPIAWLYLLTGGSGTKGHNDPVYDQGWYGSGVYLDAQWIDATSFTDLAAQRGVISDNLAAGESTPLRDVCQGDLIANGLGIIGGPDGIELLDVFPPGAINADDAVIALDSLNTRTVGKGGRGIPVDLGENKIVNDCVAHTVYDNGASRYRHKVSMTASDSVGTYGRKPRVEFKIRAIKDIAVARDAMKRIQDAYKSPYAIIDVDVTAPEWWSVKLGDVVTLTNDVVPTVSNGLAFVTPGRGITALPARVMHIEHNYPKRDARNMSRRGHAKLMIANISDAQATTWSPSAYCSARSGATCTITARYGGDEGAEFKTDDLVNLRTYDGSTIEQAEVSTAAAGSIVLKATPVIAAPFLIEPRSYATALQAAQRRTAYGTDGSHQLDDPAGAALPKVYR
ncbi:MAG: hypothetical protein ACYTBJ_16210 [Planctomycetota bacterium]|jgi:hypothetical protein